MTRKLKPIPKFMTEAEERAYWESHDSSDHVDWGKAERVRMPNLMPSTKSISLRLPVGLLERIKTEFQKKLRKSRAMIWRQCEIRRSFPTSEIGLNAMQKLAALKRKNPESLRGPSRKTSTNPLSGIYRISANCILGIQTLPFVTRTKLPKVL